jgi:hypothetical protein
MSGMSRNAAAQIPPKRLHSNERGSHEGALFPIKISGLPSKHKLHNRQYNNHEAHGMNDVTHSASFHVC